MSQRDINASNESVNVCGSGVTAKLVTATSIHAFVSIFLSQLSDSTELKVAENPGCKRTG